MKPLLIVISFCFISICAHAQGEADNWYFGNGAGIKFNSNGTITTLTNGQLNTFEGCATISDADGNLLFYTDGITVYNRQHAVMQNGNGLFGDPSSTQSAIIVPKPNDPDIFYIFTVDTQVGQNDTDNGFNYSIVNMSLDNGNGAVTQKNINLLSDCSEKITAVVKDCFEKSIWVITFATENGQPGLFNTFHAFEVNTSGVVRTSVKTTFNSLSINDWRGYLKLSSDGTKAACANASDGLYLLDFDAQSGTFSNLQKINITSSNNAPYGIEFSPNNNLLYVHASNDFDASSPTGHNSSLLQFNLTAPNISNSQVILDNRPIYRGALQLGPNGKIYRSIANSYLEGTEYLGVINNPDAVGNAANYQHNAVWLSGKKATQGLPPFIQSFFNKTNIIKNADGSTSSSLELCDGERFTLETELIANATYSWEFEGNQLSETGNTLEVINATAANSGRYQVTITLPDPSECPIIGEAQIIVNPLPTANNAQLIQCDLDNQTIGASTDGVTAFNLEQAIPDITIGNNTVLFYESTTDRDNNNPITNPIGYKNTSAFNQTIYVKVINSNGCEQFSQLNLQVQSTTASLPKNHDWYTCDIDALDTELVGSFNLNMLKAQHYPNLEVGFYTSLEDASLELNDISSDNFLTQSTTIYARIEQNNECQGVEEISLWVLETPKIELEDSFILCTDNPPIYINAQNNLDSYTWYKVNNDGTETQVENSQMLTVTAPGTYRFEGGYYHNTADIWCTNSKTFQVVPSNAALITEAIITDLSNNNTITVTVSGDGNYEYALNNALGPYQDSNTFTNVPAGFHYVFVRDKNGCGTTAPYRVSVIGYPKFFTPNGDFANDFWQLQGVDNQFQSSSKIYIFNRFGQLVAKVDPTSRGWDGTINGRPLPASDYWFRVFLDDGRQVKGHFSLIR